MDHGKPADPAWVEWAEQETIRQLRGRLERADEEQAPAELDPLSVIHHGDVDVIDLRPVREIRLEDGPEEVLVVPGPGPAMVAARANGLVVKIHRENL